MGICLHFLHEHLGFRKCHFQWVPHSMTEKEAQCRITFSEEFLQVVGHARETNIGQFINR
jgi:hypothetical protein